MDTDFAFYLLPERSFQRSRMKEKKEYLLHLLFPPRCPFCDQILFQSIFLPRELVCKQCRENLQQVREPVCSKCGKPLEEEREEYCYDCRKKICEYTQGKALWIYQGKVKDSLYRFKYHRRQDYAEYYGLELARVYGGWIKRCQIQAVVPIPLSKKRLRQRGYNQAELIARQVGKRLNLPVHTNLLLRVRDTKAQKELNDEERKNNLKRAFKTRTNKVQLDHILLIDDIYTTGSTMNEAAKELKRAGVKKIYCLCISIGRGY
ncbi:MAG: ComF family protein [Lachnospiraceae bacterium]|nr:ComF family protein [Lachnospiraceae bacterium]